MNKLILESIEDFYTNALTKIEGESEKTWNRPGFSISLIKDNMKYFVVLLSNKKDIDYMVHFENYSTKPYTENEKNLLFKELSKYIKKGEVITTEGGVTPGGISAIKKLLKYGFEEIGVNKGKTTVCWAATLVDPVKFEKWIQHADPEDYVVIDKNLPPTLDNTRPVVKKLRKTVTYHDKFEEE